MNDTTLLKEMIHDGFNIAKSSNAAVCVSKAVPLTWAVCNRRPDVVDELLKAGAQVDAYGYTNVFGSQTCTATALQIASGVGNYDMVCKLLQAGADINARGGMKLGCTALSAASINGRLDIIHLLITNNPHRQKLKYECRRAAIHVRYASHNQIARILEDFVTSLTAELGRHEIDDGIDDVYACYVKSHSDWIRSIMCSKCLHLRSTEPRKWLASVLYFGNVLLPDKSGFRLKRRLDEDETLEEIEDLLEREEEQEEEEEEGKGEEEEDVDTIDNWRLDSNEEKSNHGDEDSDHEMEADKVFEGWEDFMDVDMLGQ
ncbi:ankyrin [Viridothelium virens]|uniref:Ankyrin n=1 Tax=Viridothelium virens TaxID=1048519 RepID=A0A6A6GTP9_VIRVR|nr:ankyrin [Viridothelium virens]